MDQDAITHYITSTFAGVEVVRPTEGPGAGDTFFFYDPRRDIDPTRRLPFATIVTKDYADWDSASHLDRPDVFRLNVGVGRDTFRVLFSDPSGAAGPESDAQDFAALDQLMPHPTYARQSWVCVLNPSAATFERVSPLLAEAYAIVVARHSGRETDGE